MALLAAACLYATELNVYASGLNATTTTNVISATTIDYVLNAPATVLNVKLYDGSTLIATVPITEDSYLTKGAHTNVPVDLSNVANGTYTWALEAVGEVRAEDAELSIPAVAINNTTSRGMILDDNPESPYFGTLYVTCTNSTGSITSVSPDLSTVTEIMNATKATTWSEGASSPMRLAIGDDGFLYASDWSDNTPNITVIDRSNNSASVIFGGTKSGTTGVYVNAGGDTIHGSMACCCVSGVGAERVLYTIDEDLKDASGNVNIFRYDIGELASLWTSGPSGVAYNNSPKKIYAANTNMFLDGHGGFWVSMYRWSDGASNPALMHINAEGTVDFTSTGTQILDNGSYCTRSSLFVNHDKSKVVTTWSNRIRIFDATYTNDAISSVSSPRTVVATSIAAGSTGWAVSMDPAGNVYMLGDANLMAYAMAGDNTCETPAKVANTITVTNIEQLYEIGDNQTGGWAPNVGTGMTKVSGNVFEYDTYLSGETYFGFVTELNASWDYVNARRYGAANDEELIAGGGEANLYKNSNSFKIASAGHYIITVNFNTMKVSVESVSYPKVEIMQGWNTWKPLKMTNDAGDLTCSATLAMNAGDYSAEKGFKLRINESTTWMGKFQVINRDENIVLSMSDADNNCGLLADIAGEYEFVYTYATGDFEVTFPDFVRTAANTNYQSLCTPFDATVVGATAYEVVSADGSGVNIRSVAQLAAGQSYLLKPDAIGDIEINYIADGAITLTPAKPANNATGLYGQLVGDYTYVYNNEATWKNIFVLLDDDMFHQVRANGEVNITPTHAYLHIAGDEIVDPTSAPIRIIENTTNIDNVEANEDAIKFIQNGQMFIKKNGIVYDMMGNIVR